MKIHGKKETLILLLGDLVFFTASLWFTLYLRSWALPTLNALSLHVIPFALLFGVWVSVFYIAGLYGKHTVILQSKLPTTLLNTLFANALIAITFFYFIPFFGITPKTILFIYLGVSFVFLLYWRMYGYFELVSRTPVNACLIGMGSEMKELAEEVNRNSIYAIKFVCTFDLSRADEKLIVDEIVNEVYSQDVGVIVIDIGNEKIEPILPHLYNLIFSKVTFVDMYKVYEDIFDRVPLSLLKYNWFLENISTKRHFAYDTAKRLMDLILALTLGALSLIFYPFIALAIKLEDGGPAFITQERIGAGNRLVKIHKFRSMTKNDMGEYEKEDSRKNSVTKVGAFLRKSRLDELPQLWNVLRGDISLIGPRPELPSLVKVYEKQIAYYSVRHIIKPGLSGWAQIHQENHPHHGEAVIETREKLAYDLYYIKNRSFLLDLKIALRTIKTVFSRVGR